MTHTPRVLLIDGNEADSALAELAIRHGCAGVEVVAAADALVYADQLAGGGFQAVVCEARLPWADGMKVLRQLRLRFPDLPLFLFAAELPENLAADAVAIGLTAYLVKSSAGFMDMARAICQGLASRTHAGVRDASESAFDFLPVGLLVLSPAGVVERMNERARELLGERSGTAEGAPLDGLLPELAGQGDWQRIRRGELDHFECVITPEDTGDDHGLSLRVARRTAPDGRLDAMIERSCGGGRTLPDGNLEEVNAELEQLAYAVSHDLQEPLQLILRNARLLSDRYEDQLRDGGKKFLGHLVESTERMQSMIDGVLAYSRLQHGERNLQPISVDDILDQVLENLRPQIENASGTLERTPLPVVRVDRFQIQQLLTNLIGNAVKFRSEKPLTISVSAEDNGNEWRFAVRDNGIGFDGRFQERIFRMFQRLHTSEEYPGTGIGLAVSRKIVEQYGGRIWAESREGEGATFFFTLSK